MAKSIRLLVTGGRDYEDRKTVCEVLNKYHERTQRNRKTLCIINGGAAGLDRWARQWCKDNGVPCITMPALWTYYQKAAGAIRNQWMIDFCKPTHAVVFPGGKGTADMRRKAYKAGLIVKVVE